MPMKIEGIAVLDSNHIVVVNDNDFNFAYNATTGKVENGSVKTSFLTIKLANPLPTTPELSLAKFGKPCVTDGAKSSDLTCKANGRDLRWRR